MLPIEGQNSGRVEPLLLTEDEFQAWVARHRAAVEQGGVTMVTESNELMRGTYAMLDARGR